MNNPKFDVVLLGFFIIHDKFLYQELHLYHDVIQNNSP